MACEGDLPLSKREAGQPPSNAQVKVICGTFCTYDIFKKLDIHVRIQMPVEKGSTEIFAYNKEQQQTKVKDWNSVYVSGQLRAFERPYGKFFACRHLQELSSRKTFEEFLCITKEVYEAQEAPLISEQDMGYLRYDRLRFGHDLLLYKVTQYIVETRRQTNLWIKLLEELAQ